MSNKTKKRARRVVKQTAKAAKKLGHHMGPVLAGLAAGVAARDVAGGGNSYIGSVGKDFARLVRSLGTRAVAMLPAGTHTSEGATSETAERAA